MGEKQIEVLLGVTGSIAAYKALELVRLLRQAHWGVTVVMTRSATRLVGVESFRTLSGRPVALELFPQERPFAVSVEHIDLATGADLIIVAPATANIIGKLAAGIADDLLSTILLAVPREKVRTGRVCFAPAMNTNMWENPIVQENVKKLVTLGYRFISPGTGKLACGDIGTGRMASPEEVFAFLRARIEGLPDLKGVSVLITTGRTEEPIDPVRVITNRSSGLLGLAIAQAFRASGANVKLIAGAVSFPLPEGAVCVQTTEEMAKAVLKALPEAEILIMCAAVADYQPGERQKEKRHEKELSLRLKRTTDILKEVALRKGQRLVVGFSLDDSLTRAKAKLLEKKLDLIVANPTSTAGAKTIKPTLIFSSGKVQHLPEQDKADFALKVVKIIADLYQKVVADGG